MDREEYKITTKEASIRLGVTTRTVTRYPKEGLLVGKLQRTLVGKEWFFTEDSLESLIKTRKEQRGKKKRLQTTKDTLSQNDSQLQKPKDVQRQPEPTKVMFESNEKRSEPYKKLFEKEQGEHAKTREKLENKGTELLEYAERASRLEGEKIGDEKLRIEQSRIIKMLTDKMLKIQSPSSKDAFSQKPKDVQRQPEPTLVVSKVRPKFKRKKQTLKKSGETTPKKSNRTPQNKRGKKSIMKTKYKPPVKSKPRREAKTNENSQPKKSGFWKRLLG